MKTEKFASTHEEQNLALKKRQMDEVFSMYKSYAPADAQEEFGMLEAQNWKWRTECRKCHREKGPQPKIVTEDRSMSGWKRISKKHSPKD